MTNRFFAAVLSLALLAAMLVGCQTPTQRYAVQREALTAANHTVADLHEAGVLDDGDLRDVYPWLRVARGAIKSAGQQLPGGGDGFDDAIDQARSVLSNVRLYIVDAKQEGDE